MGEEQFYVLWTNTDNGVRQKAWNTRASHHRVRMTRDEAEKVALDFSQPNLRNVADVAIVPVKASSRARAHLRRVR
jgi:hypothetical protein